jgi:hypothetical protein
VPTTHRLQWSRLQYKPLSQAFKLNLQPKSQRKLPPQNRSIPQTN